MKNHRSGNNDPNPIDLHIQTVQEAQAALDAHMRQRIDPQPPNASPAAHKLRADWVDKRFRLETTLRLAQSAACKWETVYQSPECPAPEPTPGSGAWQKPKPKEQREAELHETEAALHALEPHSTEWLKLRRRVYNMRKRINKMGNAA